MKTPKRPNRGMDKDAVAYISDGILSSREKESNAAIGKSMDGP